MSTATYDAVKLIKEVYTDITSKHSLNFLTIDDQNGFITLKGESDKLENLPSASELKAQITQLDTAIDAIRKGATGTKPEASVKYTKSDNITAKINHVQAEIEKDSKRTRYAAHAYVLNCLLHIRTLLKERVFKATYMETIKAAKDANVAPFY